MDSRKNGNLAKLVAFFLIVTVLVMAVAFSASGWQGEDQTEPDSGNVPSGNEADENTDGETGEGDEPTPPAYTHYISGLEISEEDSLVRPLCLVYDTNAPLYGISSAFLSVELPIEGAKTRMLAFTSTAETAGKLGTLAPSRKYLSNVAAYFGAIPLYLGEDDEFTYSGISTEGNNMDLAEAAGYHYTEYGTYSYTNGDLISAFIKSQGISIAMAEPPVMPYTFATSGDEVKGNIQATTAYIQFDKGSTTELIYSSSDSKYKLRKNTYALADKLDDEEVAYDNAFILFADATTHETEDATQLILDTLSGGEGFYLNGGYAKKISWSTTDSGELQMHDENGSILSILPGTSYIAFAKSSYAASTKLA